jgi:hypothetical protein
MHARVATFEHENVDQMVDEIRRDVESGDRPPGLEDAKGVMVLVDRDKGKSMGIVFFDDEEALKRGDEALNQMTPGEGNRRTSVEFYEVPVQQMEGGT